MILAKKELLEIDIKLKDALKLFYSLNHLVENSKLVGMEVAEKMKKDLGLKTTLGLE